MLYVQTNMLAWNANRQLNINNKKGAKTAEKLSSGYRINRSADDAAGLAISEKMRRQIRGLSQSADNIQEGIGYVQTAEGALNEVHDMLQRMNELAVKAANGTCSDDDRSYIDQEIQALKSEMDRIFDTTTFNELEIWEPKEKKQIGSEFKQAVKFIGSDLQSNNVTNANCGVLSCSNYIIHATQDGVSVSWKGYDTKEYSTQKIDWDTLKKKNYRFEMSDYFGEKTADNKLYDSSGNPVFRNTITFTVEETATIDDIITCIDGRGLSGSASASMTGRLEDNAGQAAPSTVISLYTTSLSYGAAYASYRNQAAAGTNDGHNFDAADDTFLEPAKQDGTPLGSTGGNLTSFPPANLSVAEAKASTDTWTFSFNMKGIGTVQATSSGVSYLAPGETADDDETHWWNWVRYNNNYQYKSDIVRSVGAGTLGNVMKTLTGAKNSNNPGLLTAANGGGSDTGGTIRLAFSMKADTPFSFGNTKDTTSVGSFTLNISVTKDDTEETVLQKIKDSLNANTVFDLYTQGAGSDSSYIRRATAKNHEIEVPIYGGTCGFFVQASTEAGQHIEIQYDSLSIIELEMTDTNTLTMESAGDAINDIKAAMKVINKQRSDFGAYQNRLEHAYNINKNSEENTQSAESVIRDTDMAKTMVDYSNNNILLQAGNSMLVQANQSNSGVLSLLQ